MFPFSRINKCWQFFTFASDIVLYKMEKNFLDKVEVLCFTLLALPQRLPLLCFVLVDPSVMHMGFTCPFSVLSNILLYEQNNFIHSAINGHMCCSLFLFFWLLKIILLRSYLHMSRWPKQWPNTFIPLRFTPCSETVVSQRMCLFSCSRYCQFLRWLYLLFYILASILYCTSFKILVLWWLHSDILFVLPWWPMRLRWVF